MGGILAFYAAIWSEAQAAAARWRLALIVEVAMVAAWFVIRSTAGVDGRAYLLWVLAAGVLALRGADVRPRRLRRDVGRLRAGRRRPDTVPARIRAAAARGRRAHPDRGRPTAVAAGAGRLGRARPAARDRPRRAQHVRPVRHRHRVARRPFVAGQHGRCRSSCSSPPPGPRAADPTPGDRRRLSRSPWPAPWSASPNTRRRAWSPASRFEWLGFWKDFGARLSGTIPSPNALSAQLIVPTAVLGAAVLLARDLRLKAAGTRRARAAARSPTT